MIVVMMEPATKNSTQQFCRINMYTIRSFAICSNCWSDWRSGSLQRQSETECIRLGLFLSSIVLNDQTLT